MKKEYESASLAGFDTHFVSAFARDERLLFAPEHQESHDVARTFRALDVHFQIRRIVRRPSQQRVEDIARVSSADLVQLARSPGNIIDLQARAALIFAA